jgi:hypothetical protein
LPFTASTPAVVPVAKYLPPPALTVFCTAANDAEQAGLGWNDCIKAGWAAAKDAGWTPPVTGKRWVLAKDDAAPADGDGPTAGAVHVDAPLGAKKPKKDDEAMKFDTEAQVFKVDDTLGLVFGWAIVCNKNGEPYFDTQGDNIPEDAMLKASADFMQNSRVAKDMHQGDQIGPVVFAWPMTAEIAKAMGIQTDTTGLMIAMLPPPDVLAKFKDGSYTGFSIGGRREVDEDVV